ncbi:bifunctional UDP-N-acetylglucosamine diphosphorylase/glucosamine-1-phosphate N-acetyltransferase GlmU [Helicobacter sp. 11S02629-2]|uniref:bifunctional UDP-N-acetylglucosamine diphosphorylase/glucosamine-1-phosphate N-acetyltransferase GlmU n=1 Tax=Helicobacter sp. 11S02629-2 TaxID=1476195 RepID=UPI000BA6E721|nr:bifunctional UDP-N-acetylglucosamine diphosphorylase/glucosamine-1-phosphate N-acetyltransferase GlmU [Helicobacter sp. 11S02629-2]PAF44639.1 UDP-N-acetylglucosamine diphosphorylase/glucosamine-1-phosphate N-acetyltransferase [Helicobacter sp. 11S02629-2]
MLSVIIMAAGFGTRMKSTTPKVLHTICNKSLLEYVLDAALSVSKDVHLVLFNEHAKIKAYVESKYENTLKDITFHLQNHNETPGTGGTLMKKDRSFLDIKGEKVLILSGDTPLLEGFELEGLSKVKSPIVLSCFKIDDPFGYGRIKEKEGKISIVEEKDASEEEKAITLVNAGLYCFDKEVLKTCVPLLKDDNAQKEFYLTDIISIAQDKGYKASLFSVKEENLYGINTKANLAHAQDLMLKRLRKKWMEAGVIMNMPDSIYIDSTVSFEGECILDSFVSIKGKSVITNSHIKQSSVVVDSKIKDSDVGPSAHVRPNCEIESSHIGNFVECKNAKLKGMKAGHLSYLGDCEVDTGSNIGAGVITCNYDGIRKHKTLIGKNVFVGSDVQLVAPVTIADNVLIAAGSTITKNVKAGYLSISRTNQTDIENGFFRFKELKSKS